MVKLSKRVILKKSSVKNVLSPPFHHPHTTQNPQKDVQYNIEIFKIKFKPPCLPPYKYKYFPSLQYLL